MWAALDVHDPGDSDLLLAELDDFQATAIEAGDADGVRVFFADAVHRDRALSGLPSRFRASPVDVPDEDWARRSQQGLAPITVGRITIFPTLELFDSQPGSLLIQPSMGFGTGHHATTRLCLAALQTVDVRDKFVLDVGTGSGVLALASLLLGARDVVGIDSDADAIQSATENLELNRHPGHARFDVSDLRSAAMPSADILTANLTGALLTQAAGDLRRMLRGGGTLIVSGLQTDERVEVLTALGPARVVWESEEDGWIGAALVLEH